VLLVRARAAWRRGRCLLHAGVQLLGSKLLHVSCLQEGPKAVMAFKALLYKTSDTHTHWLIIACLSLTAMCPLVTATHWCVSVLPGLKRLHNWQNG
jgi:hypothetical protein